jgi:hypothetical protein
MSSEIVVERSFHFHCPCGAVTVTGERKVTCSGCGKTLSVRRIRMHQQRQPWQTVTYYGRASSVLRVEQREQLPNTAQALEALGVLQEVRDEPRGLPVSQESPREPFREGMHVRVGPIRPDGRPHPHAGKTGTITRFIDAFTNPDWDAPRCASIELDRGIEPKGFIRVSLESLEVLS